MSDIRDPNPDEQLRIGPITAVQMHTCAAPSGQQVAEALDTRDVPFDLIKDLIGTRPLLRFRPEDGPR